MPLSFDEMFRTATGNDPYPYQRSLAYDGLPELVEIPTGLGKTLATVTAWLYRRRFHDDASVRSATARRLVFVLPMRVLVEQTEDVVRGVLEKLGLTEKVHLHVLMGGEPMGGRKGSRDWRDDLDSDSIIIGTLDMIISRCLNRGYGESRYLWPIDFGLLNSGSHFIFDEVQLMGPALATSRQLHGLRLKLGAGAQTASTWMSATVDESRLATFDAPAIATRLQLETDDVEHERVRKRLSAHKLLQKVDTEGKPEVAVARALVEHHRTGTLTLAILNTVDRASDVVRALERLQPTADVVLVHSRFRPDDRKAVVDRVLAPVDTAGPGRIVVSTQVVEAGVDISSTTLLTEAAPWPSIVQRAGRCNRDGNADGAVMLWVAPPKPEPYVADDVDASIAELTRLSGSMVNSQLLGASAVPVTEDINPILRRRDLLDLFDTLPDVSGNDVDVSRFIRNSDDLDVAVAWRPDILKQPPNSDSPVPGRRERCSVPIGKFREWLKKHDEGVWRWNHLDRAWQRCRADDVHPGAVLLVDASLGGYSPVTGWTPDSKAMVAPVVDDEPAASDAATADDPLSVGASWVTLFDHLSDTQREAQRIVDLLDTAALPSSMMQAVIEAGRLHDIGKAHEVFAKSMRSQFVEGDPAPPLDVVLAKSGGNRPLRHCRRNFRHELASALALLGEGSVALIGIAEPDLVVYLVAAHHGRIRMGIRSLPGDVDPGGSMCALGIYDGDPLPAVSIPGGEVPMSTLDLGVMALGAPRGQMSWSDRALRLRDRDDIGPFRLGYLEAIVRLADWRASANPTIATGWESNNE